MGTFKYTAFKRYKKMKRHFCPLDEAKDDELRKMLLKRRRSIV
jgi:hypothetical protein